MNTGVKVTPQKGRDRVVRMAMMAVRAGFVLAVVMGVGMMVHVWQKGDVLLFHMLSGVLVLGGVLTAGVRAILLERPVTLLALGVLAGVSGAVLALSGAVPGLVHLVLMLAAVGLAEAGVRKVFG
ncbi:MAG TPA: hypothetical protein VD902_14800 [Symbiobacteriaceae bacterium]|nr:hypothetical protein [Symbiobacteriaceae bacterium]